MTSQITPQKYTLRKTLRSQRRSLTPKQQRLAAQGLYQTLKHSGLLLRARYIALYLGHDGEIDPRHFLAPLWRQRKQLFVPIIARTGTNSMRFAQLTPRTLLQKNKFGIAEPNAKTAKFMKAKQLSLVLLPLVAFDEMGNRIGMGGGYYDRAFSFLRNHARKPRLVGLAYEFQKVSELTTESWDIPLDAIATDKALYQTSLNNV